MVHAIGDNRPTPSATRGKFTVAQATEMLPLVRRIVQDLVRLNRVVEMQRNQLQGLEQVEEMAEHKLYADELEDMRGSLKSDEKKFRECVTELRRLGLEPHLPVDGGVDFPAEFDRRAVFLCWYPEDRTVMHWHEVGQPPSRRRPLNPRGFNADSLN